MTKETIGRYEVESEIGRGGMATVYLAYDPRFRRRVAIKLVSIKLQNNPTVRSRFEREAQLIAAIEHPAIVPVYDFGEQDDQPYLVMRYMPGGTLAGRIREGKMALSEVCRIISQIAPALDAVHAQGIIHRDLKPGNILLDGFGNPAISDFGIAHLTETTTDLTGSAVLGTPSYMSPEQVSGNVELDGRSDVYALGVILFEMLAGRTPYKSPTPLSLAMMHVSNPIPHICAVRPDLPLEIEGIMEKVMAKDRDERYSSATELGRDLQTLQNASHSQAIRQPVQDASTEIDLSGPLGVPSAGEAVPSKNESHPITPPSITNQPKQVLIEKALPAVPFDQTMKPVPLGKRPAWGFVQVATLVGLGLIFLILCGVLGFLGLWVVYQSPGGWSRSATPAVTATAEAAVLFSDDFSDQTSGWSAGQTAEGEYGYRSSGDFHISVKSQDTLLWVSTDRLFDNTRILVDAKVVGDGRDGYYGLLCRVQDDQNYYYFVIRPNGDYTIGKLKDGEFGSFFTEGWRYSGAILTGTQTNRVEADCVGDSLRLTVNNKLLGSATDSDFVSGKTGLAAALLNTDGFEVVFDHFLITKPGQ